MHNQHGFTLLELLIAAAIISTLAVFATQTFRRSSSDVRLQDIQARAKIIAMAAHRMKVEYPGVTFSTDWMGTVASPNSSLCNPQGDITLQTLIHCGYLDYRQYAAEVREDTAENPYKSNFRMKFAAADSYKVCVQGTTDKVVDKRCYCTDGESIDAPTASCE